MTDQTRPTLAELHAEGLDPQTVIDAIDAQRCMAGEYACYCGIHGDDETRIEACTQRPCYFRTDTGEIDAPYQAETGLLEDRKHYEQLLAEERRDEADG